MKRGGPRTQKGKAVASQNALRHGVRSALPVIPGEDADAWHAHLAAVRADLSPTGAVEEALAGRISNLLWRLGRVERFETARLTQGLERVDDDAARKCGYENRAPSNTYTGILEGAAEALNALGPDGPPEVSDKSFGCIGGAVALYAKHQLRTDDAVSVTDRVPIPKESSREATRAYITACVNAVRIAANTREREQQASLAFPGFGATPKKSAPVSEERAVLELRACTQVHLGAARKASKAIARTATVLQVRRMLPDGSTLETLTRYEAHLDRLLTRSIHELQRIQALRAGNGAAVPRALDVDVRTVQASFPFTQ